MRSCFSKGRSHVDHLYDPFYFDDIRDGDHNIAVNLDINVFAVKSAICQDAQISSAITARSSPWLCAWEFPDLGQ